MRMTNKCFTISTGTNHFCVIYLQVENTIQAGIPKCFPSGPFMLSCISLYTFVLLIMLYPVPAIDNFLEVNLVFQILGGFVFIALPALKDITYVPVVDLNSRNMKVETLWNKREGVTVAAGKVHEFDGVCVCGFAFSALFLLLCLHSDRVCSPWLARYPGHYCHRECGCVFHAGGTRRHALSGTELLFWLEHRDLHASIFFSCLKKLNQCVNVLFQVSLWFISLWL